MTQTLLLFFSSGFVLGIFHAFDADHVVAINTLITKSKNILSTLKISLFWGLGHSLTLLITALIVFLFLGSLPEKISLFFEFVVGLILIYLGLSSFHSNLESSLKKISGHKKSFGIGIAHGLAGSGVIILFFLTRLNTLSEIIFYVFIFGIGSILGMGLIALSFHYFFNILSKKKLLPTSIIQKIVASISVVVGFYMLVSIIWLY